MSYSSSEVGEEDGSGMVRLGRMGWSFGGGSVSSVGVVWPDIMVPTEVREVAADPPSLGKYLEAEGGSAPRGGNPVDFPGRALEESPYNPSEGMGLGAPPKMGGYFLCCAANWGL